VCFHQFCVAQSIALARFVSRRSTIVAISQEAPVKTARKSRKAARKFRQSLEMATADD
jgi:hypothetical protein